MIDPNKLQYFTMAEWARGYASALDGYKYKTLKFKLEKIADMLDFVFNSYIEREDNEDHE